MPDNSVDALLDEQLEIVKGEVRQYVALKDQIDSLNKRKDDIKGRIFAVAENYGEPTDKGHIVFSINEETTGTKSIVKQRRASKVFNEETADTVLTTKSLKERCVKTVEVLDEDAIMAAYYEGLLTDSDIDSMFPEKVTWALILEK